MLSLRPRLLTSLRFSALLHTETRVFSTSSAHTQGFSASNFLDNMSEQQGQRRHPYGGGRGGRGGRGGGRGGSNNFRRNRPQNQDAEDDNNQRGPRRTGRQPQRTPQEQLQQEDSDQPMSGMSTPPQVDLAAVSNPALTIDIPQDTPRFADLATNGLVDKRVIDTITQDLKFDHMTPVQGATIHELLKHTDVLAQAKTGTGKTLGFLLPAIQTMLTKKLVPGKQISLLVISPTRELAMQIAKEAESLLQRMPRYKVCLAIGGTNKDTEERRILRGCDILVGTPGRLYDHLGSQGGDVVEMLQALDTLVLDEADRLLDMGFLDALKKIIRCLPNKDTSGRQGMLFSATIADHVTKVAHLALSKDYKFISTIVKGEAGTHERVPQHLVIVPTFSDMATGLLGSLKAECAIQGRDTFKAIIFAPTAAVVDFYHDILTQLGPSAGLPPVCALHARMNQSKRTKTTDNYRNAPNGILIATDVIARGMDFPAITNVLQAGIPSDKESYIHRLGRTARAGAEGRGHFIVTAHEAYFPQHVLKEITFTSEEPDLSAHGEVLAAAEKLDTQAKTYQGWLGFYKTFMKSLGWNADTLVKEANKFALEGLGAPEVPTLQKSTVGKMGLKGVKGLVVGPDAPKAPRHGGGGGGGGGGHGRSAGNGGRGGRW